MLLDDAVADAQAQAGPLPYGLGGEEGLEDALQVLFRNPDAVVFDLDFDGPVARAGPDPDVSLVLNRMECVGQQVHEDLVELARVALDLGNVAVLPVNFDPVLVLIAQEVERHLQRGVQIDLGDCVRIHARESSQVGDDGVDPARSLGEVVDERLEVFLDERSSASPPSALHLLPILGDRLESSRKTASSVCSLLV